MSYEIKRDEKGNVVIYKDGKKLGSVTSMGDEVEKEDDKEKDKKK